MTRVNLGSGWHYKPGWINVDLYAETADVKADLRTVDFESSSILLVEATHCIEHLERADTIDLIGRVFRWLKHGGRFVVEMPERTRCLAKPALPMIKGLMGGRSQDKAGWKTWLQENATTIREEALAGRSTASIVPEEWDEPGEAHLYVWDENEFKAALEQAGFYVTTDAPQYHGRQKKRDCRWVGGKP